MLQVIFGGMAGLSLLYGLITGRGEAVAAAMLNGAEEAVQAAIAMAGDIIKEYEQGGIGSHETNH